MEKDLTNLVQTIERLATENSCEIILQNDALIATKLESGANYKAVELDDIPDNAMILDAGPNPIPAVFSNHIKDSNTIIWNGPLGAFERPPFDTSTTAIAKLVGKLSQKGNLYSIAGGGDTLAALNQAGVVKKLNYVSTAGGAFLSGLKEKSYQASPLEAINFHLIWPY